MMLSGRVERAIADRRRGAAALELAILLPVLCTLFLAVTDYARVLQAVVTISNCARSGAVFASDPGFASSTSYTSVEQAALADAPDLSPAPTVAATTGTNAIGIRYAEVTVTYQFQTLSNYLGIANPVTIRRTARVAIPPP